MLSVRFGSTGMTLRLVSLVAAAVVRGVAYGLRTACGPGPARGI